ncbi:MAG TPA: glycosyltransferase N-terminal domain-containing protein [Bacteroidota bacterium]|nr:glycosyltransferase N-terminal domain-containing protein [Bacteroidota bacterium]
MKPVWKFFYTYVFLPLLWAAIRLLGLFKRKVRRAIRGRRRLFRLLESQVARKLQPGKRIWFHASSLGEFEQAKPIIAELKRRYPEVRIIVTFFSPSGYEHSRRYPLADVVSYLPFDTPRNARRFLDLTKPDCAVIIRYDVWPNHLWELQRRSIPVLMANATMRPDTGRRVPLVRQFHRHVYNAINRILTVSKEDAEAFKMFRLNGPAIEPIGDTRYDQVSIRSAEAQKRHLMNDAIVYGKKVIVAGSSWPEDEEVLLPAIRKLQERYDNLLLIIVPHEPTVEHLEELETDVQPIPSIRFSSLNDYRGERVIVVDSIGILMALYKYAHVAYIGGGFKQNVHNVLEAAVYGIPVIYGPRHRNSQEAVTLAQRGGGFVVENADMLYETLGTLLSNEQLRLQAGHAAGEFVRQNVGATERFLKHLETYL